MANNRLWFVCRECGDRFFALKYYPSTGWYINRDDAGIARYGYDLNEWLDQHKHGTMFGTEIGVEVEQANGD